MSLDVSDPENSQHRTPDHASSLTRVILHAGLVWGIIGVLYLGIWQWLGGHISTLRPIIGSAIPFPVVLFVLATTLAVINGILIGIHARREAMRQLDEMAQRFVRLAQDDFDEPMSADEQDQIRRLERVFHVLRQHSLEAAQLRASLEDAVKARTAEVAEKMQALDAARLEAQASDRAKSHFLARMSHEIRTLLNGVIGMLRLLAAEEERPARRRHLEAALASAGDLWALTSDILAFASGEEGIREESTVAFDPRTLILQLGDHLRALAAEKQLGVDVRFAESLPMALMGDVLRIRQVLGNLISNAVKYTDQGVVMLDVDHCPAPEPGRHVVSFSISDTGVGMTREEARHAFDVYGRTVDVRRRGIEGTGLGLAIARQLTDAMGGGLTIKSEPGIGSRFTLSLSLPETDAPVGTADDILPAPGMVPARHVLVVDDHTVNRLVARSYLERFGATVVEAATGREALDAALRERFDLILLDLHLPDIHGAQLAARIERKGATVAILTADPVTDDAQIRAELGVDHLLMKPLSPRALAVLLVGGTEQQAAPAALSALDDALVLRLGEDAADLGVEAASAILAGYIEELPDAVAAIRAARTDAARRKAAHHLKGASANFGLEGLCALLGHIEAGDAAALDGLEAEAARTSLALRAAASRVGLHLGVEAGKAIPLSLAGQDPLGGFRVGLDLLAQPADEHVDGAIAVAHVAPADQLV